MTTVSYFLWIIIYGAVFIISELLSSLIGVSHCITAFAVLIYAGALAYRVQKESKKGVLIGFDIKNFKPTDILFLIPLLILPIFNLIALKNEFFLFRIILFLGVCVVEEIFFRSFLFSFIKLKLGEAMGIMLSSLAFALFHAVNLFSGFDLLFILMQVLSSFAVGVCFCLITKKFKSLTPATIIHFAINLTGVGALRISRLSWGLTLGGCCLIYLIYGLALMRYAKLK